MAAGDLREEIIAIVRKHSRMETDPTTDTDLVLQAGIDSLMALRILASIETEYGVRIPDERLAEMRTLDNIVRFIAEQRGA